MTFSEQFISIMDAVCNKFGIVINWTTENVMPYMVDLSGRIVKYEIATSTVNLILAVLVLIGTVALYKKGKRDRWDEAWIPYIFTLIFVVPMSLVMLGTQMFDIIKSIFLPEMVILKFLSQFI